jgi:glycyl-tRNA synthetase beta chain
VRILAEGRLTLDLGAAVDAALSGVAADAFPAAANERDRRRQVLDFLFERLRHVGRTAMGLRNDVMDAVLRPAAAGACDVVDLIARMSALQGMSVRPEFDPLMVGFKRAHRILEKEKWSRDVVDTGLFRHEAESGLHAVAGEAQRVVPEAIGGRDYAKALDALVRLKPSIDEFFNAVMVNAEEAEIRSNRLSLLASVDRLFMSYADFSQIAVQGG